MASKILHCLRHLTNNSRNMATGHSYLCTKTWQARDNCKNFQAISLLSVSYKLFERLLFRRQEPVFDPKLSDKQAGFRHSQCITDQVFKLICDVKHHFEEINKSGIVLADLTAAHDSQLMLQRPNAPPPPLICCYFSMDQVFRTG